MKSFGGKVSPVDVKIMSFNVLYVVDIKNVCSTSKIMRKYTPKLNKIGGAHLQYVSDQYASLVKLIKREENLEFQNEDVIMNTPTSIKGGLNVIMS